MSRKWYLRVVVGIWIWRRISNFYSTSEFLIKIYNEHILILFTSVLMWFPDFLSGIFITTYYENKNTSYSLYISYKPAFHITVHIMDFHIWRVHIYTHRFLSTHSQMVMCFIKLISIFSYIILSGKNYS